MKAICVKQPWANWIAKGLKTIETRTWKTNYRGKLLICASKGVDTYAAESYQLQHHEAIVPTAPRGVTLARVNLVDVRPMTPADEVAAMCPSGPSLFAWILEGVTLVEQEPIKGQLGLFHPEFYPIDAGVQIKGELNDRTKPEGNSGQAPVC